MTPQEIEKLPYRQNVGLMVLNEASDVFVGQRKDNNVAAWQMPQGGIDDGEDAQVAALRELEEETGITPDLVTVVAVSDGWIPTTCHTTLCRSYGKVATVAKSKSGFCCASTALIVR